MNKVWVLIINVLLLLIYFILAENRVLPVSIRGDGFFGGYTFLYSYFIFSLILIGIFTLLHKGNKFVGLFINIFIVFVALVINFIIISTYSSYKIKKGVEKSYIDNPQSRREEDPLRPISIMTRGYIEEFDGELNLEVQSIEDLFGNELSIKIEVETAQYTYDTYKSVILYYVNEEVSGRRVYRGKVYIEDGIDIVWVEVKSEKYYERKKITLKRRV